MKYKIEIVRFEDEGVEHTIPVTGGERRADKVDAGLQRQINHEKYFTRIVEEPGP